MQYESINSGTISTLLNVPVSKTHDEFASGLDSLMGHMFEAGAGLDRVIHSIMDYLRKNYNKELMDDLSHSKVTPKVLDEYEVAALMIHSDIEVTHFRRVVQALKFFTGIDKVCEPTFST